MQEYSVLMPVYWKEQPEYLKKAAKSMLEQTVPCREFVLVCDGPLTEELEREIAGLEKEWRDVFRTVRLPEQGGISRALAAGVRECRCPWIARMDSDDIACGDRCEKQLSYLEIHPEIDVLGGAIAEFDGAMEQKTGFRRLPCEETGLRKFARRRNPLNHMTVMMRREAVLWAGNYREMPGAEDYELWVRMLNMGFKAANLPEVLVHVRAGAELIGRRGGLEYARHAIQLQKIFYRSGFLTGWEAAANSAARLLGALMPEHLRALVYRSVLRNRK